MDKKKSRNPKETLSPDKKNFNLKNKNPKNIRTKGKKKATPPKYLSRRLFMKIKELPFFVKERSKMRPVIIKPNAKIE